MPRYVITLSSATRHDSFFAKSFNIEASTPPPAEDFVKDFQEFNHGFSDVKVISVIEFTAGTIRKRESL